MKRLLRMNSKYLILVSFTAVSFLEFYGLNACNSNSSTKVEDTTTISKPIPIVPQPHSYFNKDLGLEWKYVYGSGSMAIDEAHFLQPPHALKIIAQNPATSIIEKQLESPIDVCSDMDISLQFWASSTQNLSGIGNFSIMLISGSDLKDNASYPYETRVHNPLLTDAGHWTTINLTLNAYTKSPTFNCYTVSRIRISLSSKLDLQDSLTIGELSIRASILKKAILLITEDDQWADFDTNATPILQKYHFPATIYANGGLLGVYNKLGLERLKTLQDSGGWTIANHLWTHDSITNLSNDSAFRSMKMNSEFLRDRGFTGYKHFAYPYGRTDRAKDSIARGYLESARLVEGDAIGQSLPYGDKYRLPVLGFLQSGVTLDLAKNAIKNLVENKTVGILGVHQIVVSGVLNGNKWYRSDWEALIEYVHGFVTENKLEVMSLEDFWKKNSVDK